MPDRYGAAPLLLVVLTLASYGVGLAIGLPWLVPILNTAASYPFMVAALRRGDLTGAMGRMLLWALTLAVCATLLAWTMPVDTGRLFLRARAYQFEMDAWVRTGIGAESTPSVFIPQHLQHAAAFSALAVVSGGMLAMPFGALLMNYMGYYVGTLPHLAGPTGAAHAWTLLVLGWHPWSVIRVASFVVLGVALSVPLAIRGPRPTQGLDWPALRPWLAGALIGLLLDLVVKGLLAPWWQRLLLGMLT